MGGPTINRGSSEQVVETPRAFLAAVESKFEPLAWDLAALDTNHKAPRWITPEQDSLSVDWHKLDGLLWLNCEYANIGPWVKKCANESRLGAEILLLVPGSIGANWYWDFVEPYADVYSVGRMVFENCYDKKTGLLITTPYPKDLILCHYYDEPLGHKRMERWPWKLKPVTSAGRGEPEDAQLTLVSALT